MSDQDVMKPVTECTHTGCPFISTWCGRSACFHPLVLGKPIESRMLERDWKMPPFWCPMRHGTVLYYLDIPGGEAPEAAALFERFQAQLRSERRKRMRAEQDALQAEEQLKAVQRRCTQLVEQLRGGEPQPAPTPLCLRCSNRRDGPFIRCWNKTGYQDVAVTEKLGCEIFRDDREHVRREPCPSRSHNAHIPCELERRHETCHSAAHGALKWVDEATKRATPAPSSRPQRPHHRSCPGGDLCTLGSPLASAELCRRRGWYPSVKLEGDEGYGTDVIELRAIGLDGVLARDDETLLERKWTLKARCWGEVQP